MLCGVLEKMFENGFLVLHNIQPAVCVYVWMSDFGVYVCGLFAMFFFRVLAVSIYACVLIEWITYRIAHSLHVVWLMVFRIRWTNFGRKEPRAGERCVCSVRCLKGSSRRYTRSDTHDTRAFCIYANIIRNKTCEPDQTIYIYGERATSVDRANLAFLLPLMACHLRIPYFVLLLLCRVNRFCQGGDAMIGRFLAYKFVYQPYVYRLATRRFALHS